MFFWLLSSGKVGNRSGRTRGASLGRGLWQELGVGGGGLPGGPQKWASGRTSAPCRGDGRLRRVLSVSLAWPGHQAQPTLRRFPH